MLFDTSNKAIFVEYEIATPNDAPAIVDIIRMNDMLFKLNK
jgi:hypothetical protein